MASSSCRRLLFACVAWLAGCGATRGLPGPAPEVVVPAMGWTGGERAVEIHGRSFFATAVRRLEGDPFATSATFRAWLGGTELLDVRYVDAETLAARVPAGLPAGQLTLTVEAPDGTRGAAPDAYLAFADVPARLDMAVSVQPTMIPVGAPVVVEVAVTNAGDIDARDVVPLDLVESGGGSTVPSAFDPVVADLPGGATVRFTTTRTANLPGQIRFAASATGTDTLTGEPLSADAPVSTPVTIVGCAADTDCDDGLFCNGPEACSGYACVPGAPPCADDGLACTTTCDEAAAACNTIMAGACLIAGTCRAAGQANPAEPCQECDPAADPVAWTADDTNACDDGLFCDGPDACSAGACVPSGADPCASDGLACTNVCDEALDTCPIDALSCVIGGVCRAVGEVDPANPCEECDPATSQIAWKADDANQCDDGLFCNGLDTCAAGVCVAAPGDPCVGDGLACTNGCDEVGDTCAVDPGTCAIAGACRVAGEIDPANPCQECVPAASQIAWTADDTNVCDDGLYCDGPESCSLGTCLAGMPPCADDGLSCTITCDEAAGACNQLDPAACLIEGACWIAGATRLGDACQECDPAASPSLWTDDDTNVCDDGNACTTGDACGGGACAGAWTCAINTPPLARLAITPGSGTTATPFALDASASTDREDPPGALEFRWDYESDGVWDTPFSASPVVAHAFASLPAAGWWRVSVQVRDTGGLTGQAVRTVALGDAADEIFVTTLADESDAGATPASPGGTGFSLREAILYVGTTAGRQVVSFDPALPAGAILLGSALPTVDQGDTLVGRADVAIDGTALGGSARCLNLDLTGQVVIGLDVAHCVYGIVVDGNANQVFDCRVHDGDSGIVVWNAGGHWLAGNEAFGNASVGLGIWGNALVEDNVAHDNATNIEVGYNAASGSVVRRNVSWNSGGVGLKVYANADDVALVHNTVSGSAGHGVSFVTSCERIDFRNNLVADSGGTGLALAGATFVAFSSNDVWAAAAGACAGTACASQVRAYFADPRFVDAATGDLRLLPGSPLVDLGLDLGVDMNGLDPGSFYGSAPEIGATEAPGGF